ncbi:MAG TPA: hypothetical protein VNS58_16925 [Puia sp.]|nr:hypothetical protein [Puia sp.]
MKKFLFFSVTLVSLFVASCKKTTITSPTTPTNPNPIVGLWVGLYQVDGAASLGSFYYGLSLFSDSTIIQQGGTPNGQIYTSAGTWSLHDSLFSATLTGTDLTIPANIQTITAIYDSTAGTLSSGKMKYVVGGNTTGTFSLKRVK